MPFGIEIDSDLYYRQPAEGKPFGILLQVYLTEGFSRAFVQLQLYYI